MAPSIKSVVKSSWGFVSSALSSRRAPQASASAAETEAEPPRKARLFRRNKLTTMTAQPPTPFRHRRREDFGFPVLGSERDRQWEEAAFRANPQEYRRTPGRVHFAPFVTFFPNPPYPDTDDEDEADPENQTASTPADAHARPAKRTPPSPANIAISVFLEQIPAEFPKPAPTQPSDPLRFQDEFLTSHVFGPLPELIGPLPAQCPYEISSDEARLCSIPYTPVSLEELRLLSSAYTPFGSCRNFPLHTVSRDLIVEELNQDSFLPDAPALVEDGSTGGIDSPVPEPQSQAIVAAQVFSDHYFQSPAEFSETDDQDIELPDADDQDIDLPDAPVEPEELSAPPQTPIRQITQPAFVQTPAAHHPPFLHPSHPSSEPATPEPATPEAGPVSPPSPAPDSPGDERGTFTYRRNTEGTKFALQLFTAIRNDHYMRECHCGLPTIYTSKQAAQSGKGHLRFYVLDGNVYKTTAENFCVIQKKTDLQWHCSCSKSKELDLVYRKHIYENDYINSRKRPAEDSEVELRADTAQEDPMWDFVTNQAANMTATIKTFLGTWCPKFISDHIETIQTRSRATDSTEAAQSTNSSRDAVVVKRFKRQHALPIGTAPEVDLSQIPGLRWASDPTRYIGFKNINSLHAMYLQELVDIDDGKIRGASSTPHLWMGLERARGSDDLNVIASINIHRTMEDMFGCVAFDNDEVRLEKWQEAQRKYYKNLIGLLSFIEEVYAKDAEFNSAKSRFPVPPTNRRLGKVEFAQASGAAARFITWLLHGNDWVSMSAQMADVLAKMLADADAIHKHELVPSWVEYPGHNEEGGTATTGIIAPSVLWDEVPIEQFKAEAGHEVRFPASLYPPTPARRKLPNVIESSPAPILKNRQVAFPEDVASPSYVATPLKSRTLSFYSPALVKLSRAVHEPARVLKPAERKRLGKEGVKQAEDSYQLREYHLKYDNFLRTMEDNINLQKEFRQVMASRRQRDKVASKSNVRIDIARPTTEDREARHRRDEETHRAYELKKNLSGKLTALKEHPVLSPGTKRKAIREPLLDTPEDRHKFLDITSITPVSSFKPSGRRPLNIDFAKQDLAKQVTRFRSLKQQHTPLKQQHTPSATPRDRRQLIDDALDRRQLIDALVGDEDDDAEDLTPKKGDQSMAISAKKQEDLELTRHLKGEVEDTVTREVNAAKKRAAEKKARIAAEAEAARLRKELIAAGGLRNPKAALVTALTQDWVQKVQALGHAHPRTPLAQTLEGTALDRRDFVEMLLPETAWLNDNIINGSILSVAAAVNEAAGNPATPKCAAFTSFFYNFIKDKGPASATRTMKRAKITKANFLDIETILIPICQGQHWTLAVVRPRDGIVAHIDSMKSGNGNKAVTDIIMEWVRVTLGDQFEPDHWRVHQYKAPRQTNAWDCGVFTITNALCQALGIKMDGSYSQNQLTLQRSRIAAMLLNGGWTGDFGLEAY